MSADQLSDQSVAWFRQASPYINAHRDKTVVIWLSGETIAANNFSSLIHDIALLHHLGVRLLLVCGVRHQIELAEQINGQQSRVVNGLRVTDDQAMKTVIGVTSTVRTGVEAAISSSLPNTPMSGARISIVSGNFITARPYGIHDGVDYQHTGVVRRVHAAAIKRQLDAGNVVLLSSLGFSVTGEVFNLHTEDIAAEVAIALEAEKLVFFLDHAIETRDKNTIIRQTTPAELQDWIAKDRCFSPQDRGLLSNAIRACNAGIKRVHLLDRHIDGALIKELFTRDGVGTMVSSDNYEGLRNATINDVGGIIDLITPLEEDGTLVRRSREQLEMEIANFAICERDGVIVACAALYEMGRFGEIACVATHRDYQNSGRAEQLMDYLEAKARTRALHSLFVFTTRTQHWFQEQGFVSAALDDLPEQRQQSYNFKRNSKVLIKSL